MSKKFTTEIYKDNRDIGHCSEKWQVKELIPSPGSRRNLLLDIYLRVRTDTSVKMPLEFLFCSKRFLKAFLESNILRFSLCISPDLQSFTKELLGTDQCF